jgi:hypothetical protein
MTRGAQWTKDIYSSVCSDTLETGHIHKCILIHNFIILFLLLNSCIFFNVVIFCTRILHYIQ